MAASNSKVSARITTQAQTLKPMWSPLFNLGIASVVAVISAVTAFALTSDLRDGGTLVAVPIGILVWFVGDILRWRGRFPMRLFLMVPIFVAMSCTVSLRFFQKANQRRIAWDSMITAGANVNFSVYKLDGWVQFEEGLCLPEFLVGWFGAGVFANSATVSLPLTAFAEDGPDIIKLRTLDLERLPRFQLLIVESSRNRSKIDVAVFSKLVNSSRVGNLQIHLFEPSEEAIQAFRAIQRPYLLYLSGVLTEKAMRHLPQDSPVQHVVMTLNDPPDRTSWLDFLASAPSATVRLQGTVSAASLQTIDPDRSLGVLSFYQCTLDDSAILELAKLNGPELISFDWSQPPQPAPSQDAIEALCKSPVSINIGPIDLSPTSVQLLVKNEARSKLFLRITSIDSASFKRLLEVKSLKSLVLSFELTDEDIKTLSLFPKDIELTVWYHTNKSKLPEIDAAITNRR